MTNLTRFCFAGALVISAAVLSSQVQAATNSADGVPFTELKCGGYLDAKALAAIEKQHPELKDVTCPEKKADAAPKAAAEPPRAANAPAARTNVKTARANDPPADKTADKPLPDPFGLLLRNDWSDVGLLGTSCFQQVQKSQTPGKDSTVSASNAKGATASFARDYAGNNKIWQAQAMAAVTYSACDLNLAPWPNAGYIGTFEKTVAIYAQVNSDYNSNAALAKKNNQDTRTAGLSGEFGFLYSESFNVIRVIPNVVFDNIKNTTDGAVELQYVPIWVGNDYIWHFTPLFDSFFLRFDPTLDLQYASAMGHSKGLQFSSGKDQSLRLGPELTFIIDNDSPGFWGNVVFSETFHPWYETYSSRGNYWWDNSVVYNVTKNIGLKFSYDRGQDENSGATTNQYTVSLTGKI